MSDLSVVQRMLADGWSNSVCFVFTVVGGEFDDNQVVDDFVFSDHELAVELLAERTSLTAADAERFYDLFDAGEWDDAVRLLTDHDICLTVGGLILQLNYNE